MAEPTNGYVTMSALSTRLVGSTTLSGDDALVSAINAASRDIDQHCKRVFYEGSSEAREYYGRVDGRGRSYVLVDDISSNGSITVKTDTTDDGTFDTTWTSDDYQTEPRNGVVDGTTGWPTTRIVAVEARRFPTAGKRTRVEVTATYGWAATPAAISEAAAIHAARIYRRKDTPEGIAGGFEVGPIRVSSRIDPDVQLLLQPFVKPSVDWQE